MSLDQKIWAVKRGIPTMRKETEGYQFKFVSLEDIEKTLLPLLDKEGLIFNHKIELFGDTGGTEMGVVTRVFEASKPEVAVTSTILIPKGLELPKQNEMQSVGSAITYAKRYNLSAIFDILGTDRDVDEIERRGSNETPAPAPDSIDYIAKVNELIKLGRTKDNISKYLAVFQDKMKPEEVTAIQAIINGM